MFGTLLCAVALPRAPLGFGRLLDANFEWRHVQWAAVCRVTGGNVVC